jgi:polysaccharide biosynthesis protein PslG
MRTTRSIVFFLGILFILMSSVACVSQDPIIIVITPTPVDASPMPVAEPETALPTELPPLATPVTNQSPTPVVVSPIPEGTRTGSITDPSYALPTQPPWPTATPLPTETQGPTRTPGPTNIPAATHTPDLTQKPPLPNLDPAVIGVQIDQERPLDDWAYALDRTTQLGIGWVKIQVSWLAYQANGPDQQGGPEMDSLDHFLEVAEGRGINVLISVAKAPLWARSDQEEDGPPDDPQALASFLSFLFTRRGGMTVDAVEIWNEPNLRREWQGQPMTGAAYMRYFTAAYNAIRAFSPTMPIITAGLAPTSDSDVSRDDRAYLREMYAAGLGNYHDVYIGVHPYSWGNSPDARCCDLGDERGWDDDPHFFFIENIDAFRTIMNQNGHNDVQLWATEFGWATWDGFGSAAPEPWMTYNTRWDQANYIIRAFEIGQQRPDIGVMFLWNLNFATTRLIERRDERAAYGIVPYTTAIRPAFWMIWDAVRPGEVRDSYE